MFATVAVGAHRPGRPTGRPYGWPGTRRRCCSPAAGPRRCRAVPGCVLGVRADADRPPTELEFAGRRLVPAAVHRRPDRGARPAPATNGSTSTGLCGLLGEPAARAVPLPDAARLAGRPGRAGQRRPARRRRRDAADHPGAAADEPCISHRSWTLRAPGHRAAAPSSAVLLAVLARRRRAHRRAPTAASSTTCSNKTGPMRRRRRAAAAPRWSTRRPASAGTRSAATSDDLEPVHATGSPTSSGCSPTIDALLGRTSRRSGPQLRRGRGSGRRPGGRRSPSRSIAAVRDQGTERRPGAASTGRRRQQFDAAARRGRRRCRHEILALRDAVGRRRSSDTSADPGRAADRRRGWWSSSPASRLLLLLDRLVSRPVTDLADAGARRSPAATTTRQIASRRLARAGARSADDVDAMRRQIAAELAEVREARAAGRVGQRAAGAAGRGADPVQPRPGAVRLRRLARPAGAAAQGGQLLPAAAAPLRRAARRAGRPVHRVRGRRRAADAAADQRPAGVLPDRPAHHRLHRRRPRTGCSPRCSRQLEARAGDGRRDHLVRPADGARARSRCSPRCSST